MLFRSTATPQQPYSNPTVTPQLGKLLSAIGNNTLSAKEKMCIRDSRKETHDAYVGVVELSLLGESVLEWDDKDVAA